MDPAPPPQWKTVKDWPRARNFGCSPPSNGPLAAPHKSSSAHRRTERVHVKKNPTPTKKMKYPHPPTRTKHSVSNLLSNPHQETTNNNKTSRPAPIKQRASPSLAKTHHRGPNAAQRVVLRPTPSSSSSSSLPFQLPQVAGSNSSLPSWPDFDIAAAQKLETGPWRADFLAVYDRYARPHHLDRRLRLYR